MAAQYDVNLEKCALLKCLCGSAFAAGQSPVRSLALKIAVIFGGSQLLRINITPNRNRKSCYSLRTFMRSC